MKKERPNPDKLANELLGASAFFRANAKDVAEPNRSGADREHPSTPASDVQRDVTTSRRHDTTTSTTSPEPAGFDINRPTASRDSLRLAVDETKALDALRASLKWDYDLSVSKNDICRAALHALLQDFASKGDRSDAVKRLKRKQTSR